MPLKNYTTSIESEKSVMEIEKILSERGASKVMKEYDAEGGVAALCFIIPNNGHDIPFRLPMRADAVMLVLSSQNRRGKLSKRFLNIPQARRIGWRILRDWVDAQMALVEIGMAKTEEVFMPYLYDVQSGRTLYEVAATKGLHKFLLAAPK